MGHSCGQGKSLPLAVMDSNPLSEFLVVDDYGTGGIWFVVRAANEDDIRAVLPKVVIYPSGSRPEWMSASPDADPSLAVSQCPGDEGHCGPPGINTSRMGSSREVRRCTSWTRRDWRP